ncbi:hypothetical protein FH972_011679 [Carpinus fangiana]|uniref:BHLH domain-containing protein n=1 Tax=Carpinus fangiana TaxID=176857 RepID=A0A660KTV1_9ROSI|nr:hypothetical protein FH972_011679 [Carpinus fangiana]
MTTEHKRSPCSVEQSSPTSLASKRHMVDLSAKERKEKLGERIVALQQLVSPYGKSVRVHPDDVGNSWGHLSMCI